MPATPAPAPLAARLARIAPELGAACARLDAALEQRDARRYYSLAIDVDRAPVCERCVDSPGWESAHRDAYECRLCEGTCVAYHCSACHKPCASAPAFFVTDDGKPVCRACLWATAERVLDAAIKAAGKGGA